MTTLSQFEKFYCVTDKENITNKGVVVTYNATYCIKHYHLSWCLKKESDCEQWHD